VHGDVCPENIDVTEDGVTKVVDFGVARLVTEGPSGLIRTHAAYAAPERLAGGVPHPSHDVYSLGCVLCVLADTHRVAERPPVARLAALPLVAADIARRMMIPNPRLRTITMAEVADVLDPLAATASDVATFLESELGSSLAARRARVTELVDAPTPANLAQLITARRPGDTTTLIVLESFLEETTTQIDPPCFNDC
jgi:serine/threonine protein kinase